MKNTPSQVRGTISPDGTTVVCGSENGELLFWRDGKAVVPPTVPQVRGGDRGTRRGVVVRMDIMKAFQGKWEDFNENGVDLQICMKKLFERLLI